MKYCVGFKVRKWRIGWPENRAANRTRRSLFTRCRRWMMAETAMKVIRPLWKSASLDRGRLRGERPLPSAGIATEALRPRLAPPGFRNTWQHVASVRLMLCAICTVFVIVDAQLRILDLLGLHLADFRPLLAMPAHNAARLLRS